MIGAALAISGSAQAASPQEELEEILEHWSEKERATLLDEALGTKALHERAEQLGSDLTLKLQNLDGVVNEYFPEEFAKEGALSFHMQANDSFWRLGLGVSLAQEDVATISLQGEAEQLTLEIPQLFDGALAIRSGSLLEQYQGSALEKMIGKMPADLDMDLQFIPDAHDDTDAEEEADDRTALGRLEEAIEDSIEHAKEATSVEKDTIKDTDIYSAVYDTSSLLDIARTAVDGYLRLIDESGMAQVTNLEETLQEFQDAMDTLEQSLDSTIDVEYYVQDANIISINATAAFIDSSVSDGDSNTVGLSASLDFHNPKAPEEGFAVTLVAVNTSDDSQFLVLLDTETKRTQTTSETTVHLTAATEDETAYDNDIFKSTFDSSTGRYTVRMDMESDGEPVSLLLDSTFEDIVPGEKFRWIIDEMTVSTAGQLTGFKGTLEYISDAGDPAPEKNTRYIMELDEDSLTSLITEITLNSMNWVGKYIPENNEPETDISTQDVDTAA